MNPHRLTRDRKVYSQAEEAAQRAEDLADMEVDGVSAAALLLHVPINTVPHVNNEKVVKAKAPPAEWALQA